MSAIINNSKCSDDSNCTPGICPDFMIKRHDTLPVIRVSVDDCDGPIDLTDSVVEVSMWANAKLKTPITENDNYFALADNIGFYQVSINDIIVVQRVRSPEQMLVVGFDENLKLIRVIRGYNGTTTFSYAKGQKIKIFRLLNAIGETETVTEDQENLDGTIETDVLTESNLIYKWTSEDTCYPGCYFLEFKLLKMEPSEPDYVPPHHPSVIPDDLPDLVDEPNIFPSAISFISSSQSCGAIDGVESIRRFPSDREGFIVKINDSPTAENVF